MFKKGEDRIEYGGAMIGEAEIEAIMNVIKLQGGRRWTVGPESVAFEEELARKTGVNRATVVNSGSSALLAAMTALHLPKNSYVVIPALNFPTAYNAILQTGNIPYVVDIDPDTLLIDLEEVKKAVKNEKIAAVIPVNIASNPVNVPELRSIVGNIPIILDNCDGYGTLYRNKFVDAYADMSCVSFHAAHIITTGEGGAVLTNNEEYADRVQKIREWGRASGTDKIYRYEGFPDDYRERYVYEEIGYNLKPLELQCAMGRVQLTKLNTFRDARLRNYEYLYKLVQSIPYIKTVEHDPEATVCWFSFPMLIHGKQRSVVMDMLEKCNIETRTIFSGNILRHPAYKNTRYNSHGDMPNADRVMREGMFLSVHPSITREMIEYIYEVLWKLQEV